MQTLVGISFLATCFALFGAMFYAAFKEQSRRENREAVVYIKQKDLEDQTRLGRESLSRLTSGELSQRSQTILFLLVKSADWQTYKEVGLNDLTLNNASTGEAIALLDHLEQRGYCKLTLRFYLRKRSLLVHDRSKPRPEDVLQNHTVALTGAGYSFATSSDAQKATRIGSIIMGDHISAGKNAVIINRSALTNSMNSVDRESAEAIERLAAHVEKSGSDEGAELMNEFNKEIATGEPRKSILKALYSAIETAVPTINQLTEATSKIMGLFQ